MNCDQRLCKFCDYRWLWILVIIIPIIATKAERNSFKDFFETYFVNNTDYNKELIERSKIDKLVTNSTQRSVSRPSTVLKELWSSASDAENQSNDNTGDSSQSFAVKLKEFLFRPTKWSSDIVPSIPLSLQLSSDAIKLSPHLKEGKSTTRGDITVINGFSSSISYPPKDYKLVDRNQQNSEPRLQLLNGVITPSSLILTTNRQTSDISSTLESLKNEVTLPFIDLRINATSIPMLNHTIPTKIITTTATIVSSTEPQRRSGELYSNPTLTTFRSIQTTHGLTEKPKMSPSELRRQAIRQRFGNSNNFGVRISRTPPKVSIDKFLSVYKPTLKNQFFSDVIKSRVNSRNENSTKILKNISENKSVKPKLLTFNKSNEMQTKGRTNQTKPYLMSTENRNTLSSLLLFPSRPKPILRPKLSNITEDYNGLKEFDAKNSRKASQKDVAINTQNKNISKEDISERRSDDRLIESVSKKNLFGYRKKLLDGPHSPHTKNQFNDNSYNYDPLDDSSAQGLQLESIMNPQIDGGEMPLMIGEDHQYLPPDEMMGAHKHYLNQLKLQEENLKYQKIPNPDLFKNDLRRPEEEAPKFSIKPVNPQYYKPKKVKPTLPNKVMQFEEMMRHLASVLRSINRLTPVGRSLSDKYKEITTKLKFDIMANKSKGPYARYYPPGPYDDIYSPEPVEEKYRRSDEDMSSTELNERYHEMPDNYTFIDRMDDISTDNNNTYTFNDYDDDGLIKKSFGYRVTVYRSPEKGESNVTEEVLDDDKDLNGNKSDDLSVSESSDEYSVTTDSNNNGTEYLMTSASNLLRGESQSGLKGNAKGVDYKRNKYNREKGSHAKEEVNMNKSKKVDSHDRRANNEKALKERTIIEFFEREHILDTAYNKDKLGIDKSDHKDNDDQHASGSMTKTVTAPEHTVANGTLNAGEIHQFANSDLDHVTNSKTFDTIFPEHDRKYKHKDNAHKYKGWKERGYKIITETEFVDRGRRVDSGFKKHINGSKEHIKEHSAGDITKADFRKYNKNMKNINKNYEALYGNRVKSPQHNYEKKAKNTVVMPYSNADDYHKYYNNNNVITSGESQVNEEHKPYDSQLTEEQTSNPTEDPTYDPTYDPTIHTSEPSLEQSFTEGITSGDTSEEVSTPEDLSSTEEKPSEENTSEKTFTEDDENDSFTTDNFQAPPVDTENYWRPITSTVSQFNNNQGYYPKTRPYNNYVNYNNGYNNNVYPNDNTNENYDQSYENNVNNDIDSNKGFPTISSDTYGSGNNPYSMPLVSEEVHSYPSPNGAAVNPNAPQMYNNDEYFYQPIPNTATNEHQNKYSNGNRNKKNSNHFNNSYKLTNDPNYADIRNYRHFRPNSSNHRPTFDVYPEPQLTPNYPPMAEMLPTAEVPIATNQPYFNYQIYPPDNQNQVQQDLNNVPKGRPLFAIIGDESKKVEKINDYEMVRNRKTSNQLTDNKFNLQKAQNMENIKEFTQTLSSSLSQIKDKQNYVKPIKINTIIPGPIPPPMLAPKPNQNKKKRKKTAVFPVRPLMSPSIDNLFMNTNPMQTYLSSSSVSNLPLHMKLPFKFGSTALPPTHMLSFDSNLSPSADQPIAILHPNKMLTLTTTSLLRNKFGDHFVAPNQLTKPLQLVLSRKQTRNMKRVSAKRRSIPLRNKWFPQKLRKKRRSFKEIFSFRNWFKSKFQS